MSTADCDLWFSETPRADTATFAVQYSHAPNASNSWLRGLDTVEQAEYFAAELRAKGCKVRVWREWISREIMEGAT